MLVKIYFSHGSPFSGRNVLLSTRQLAISVGGMLYHVEVIMMMFNYNGYQYHWSIPAALKNALDYLYYEWRGKPAAIVTYGGRGGGKAEGHLRQILQGLRMDTVVTTPALVVKKTTLGDCLRIGQVSVEDRERWREDGVEEQMKSMLVDLLEKVRGL
ncbi:hypothetical protein BDW75DRAFT_245691 [Aspergillus navahoensis]